MDKFENQLEDLEVRSQYVEASMNQTTTLSTPQDQVSDAINLTPFKLSLTVP